MNSPGRPAGEWPLREPPGDPPITARDHHPLVSITSRVLLAFSLVLLVVLGLGLWSLHATRRLHDVNQALLHRGLPALRLERALADHIPALIRHETRAIVLKDPTYQTLHHERAQKFQAHLQALAELLEGREATGPLRSRFAEYLGFVEQEWAALGNGSRDEALRLAEGPSRQAVRALEVSVEALLAQSLAELEHMVGAAGNLQRSAHTATILSVLVSLAVGLGLAGMVTLRVARPIRALSHATQLVARGEYDLPIAAGTHDEVGDLTRAFRSMAQTLQQLDRFKEEFFAKISHDFRSPLSSIQMAARLLRNDPLTSKQEHWLDIIHSTSETLLRLTHQILELAKLRSGMLRLDLARVDLQGIVEHAALELQPLAAEKGITLSVTLPIPSPQVCCDAGRMQQVLANLLSNGIKFTPEGGQVHVTGREEGPDLVVLVEDTGVGIPAAELPHVFEPYRQAHGGMGGTGLGLAIVKGLVEAHGGRVWTESRQGEGTRFYIALPREGPQR